MADDYEAELFGTSGMSFEAWLEQASEEDKRAASRFRHHFPVEVRFWEYSPEEPDAEAPEQRETVCGCNEAFGYKFMSEGHRPGDPIYVIGR